MYHNSLWIGKSLPVLQRLCLASAIGTGARVRLFTYEPPVEGVPEGVEVANANEILGIDKMIRHRESQSVALFSDRFRYEILAKALGAWIDTDLLFLKAPSEDGECLVGWEDEELIGSAFIWIKPDRPLINELRRLAAKDYLVPPWLPARRIYLSAAKLLGRGKHVSDLDWGVIGPHLLTWLLQTNNMLPQAQPKWVFSPLPWEDRGRISDAHFNWRALIKPETVCVHLWNWGLTPQLRTQRPEPGSLLDEVAQKCGFDWPDQ